MPFISSIRSSFGPQRLGKGRNVAAITGGATTTSGGYRIHTFTTSGNNSFDLRQSGLDSLVVEYLIVGGGGQGGGDVGGGGGAGGLRTGSISIGPDIHNIVVGGQSTTAGAGVGADGNPSSAFSLISNGGGGGGSWGPTAGRLWRRRRKFSG